MVVLTVESVVFETILLCIPCPGNALVSGVSTKVRRDECQSHQDMGYVRYDDTLRMSIPGENSNRKSSKYAAQTGPEGAIK